MSNKKLVIAKQIPVELFSPDEREAALNEGMVLSLLDHPNIIRYHESFIHQETITIIMDYATGGTLHQFLENRNHKLLPEKEILHLFAQLLLGLKHVHDKNILHRDLKSQNVLLNGRQDVVMISDFGISKVLASKTKAVTVVGTPSYLSPELCEGKSYNKKSDIWALGCILYEMTALHQAFEADTLPALVLKILRGEVAPIPCHFSRGLRELLTRMLQLDHNKRPSIEELMSEPVLLNPVFNLFTDMGRVSCRSTLATFGPEKLIEHHMKHFKFVKSTSESDAK